MNTIKFHKQDRQVVKTIHEVEYPDGSIGEWIEELVIPANFAVINKEDVYFGFELQDIPPSQSFVSLSDRDAGAKGLIFDEPKPHTREVMAKLEAKLGSHSKALNYLNDLDRKKAEEKGESYNPPSTYIDYDKFGLSKDKVEDYFNKDGLTYIRFKSNAFNGSYRTKARNVLRNINRLKTNNKINVEPFYKEIW